MSTYYRGYGFLGSRAWRGSRGVEYQNFHGYLAACHVFGVSFTAAGCVESGADVVYLVGWWIRWNVGCSRVDVFGLYSKVRMGYHLFC
jgi:hypothetical protein